MQSQEKQILKDLQSGQKITPLDALANYQCFRLGARIHRLKQAGHNIKTEIISKRGKRYAQYSMH